MTIKQKFVKEFNEKVNTVHWLVVAVRLPEGQIELISNHMGLQDKFQYYIETYDKDLRMYNNNRIQIVNWMIV